MKQNYSATLAWSGSIILILAVLYFQYVEGLAPCVLCIYQRIPHISVIALGALSIWRFPSLYPLMAMLIFGGVLIAGFHVGVEQHWWQGLKTCSGEAGLSFEALLEAKPARCDEIAWSFLGLSMAAWNMVISILLAGLWIKAWRDQAS